MYYFILIKRKVYYFLVFIKIIFIIIFILLKIKKYLSFGEIRGFIYSYLGVSYKVNLGFYLEFKRLFL